MDYKILQVMPAVGWCVFYEESDGSEFGEAVACFALIEETHPDIDAPYQMVVAMVPDGGQLTRVDEANNFKDIRYVPDFKPDN